MRESLATPYLKNENAFFDISLGFFLIVIGDSKVLYHKGIANGAEIYLPLF
jgi:hypothetical protein